MSNAPRFEVFPEQHSNPTQGKIGSPTGDYGWRFRAANGQISAIGGEGFTRREDAHRAVVDFCRALGLAFDGPGRPPDCHNVIPPVIDVDE